MKKIVKLNLQQIKCFKMKPEKKINFTKDFLKNYDEKLRVIIIKNK